MNVNSIATDKRQLSRLGYALLLILALALPFLGFMDRSKMSVAVLAGIYVILGLSLNIIVGYAGLFQLGHAAFYGLGAYTTAILSINYGVPVLLSIPIAALIAGIAAIIISKPILHLRGDYLCIVTIAFGEIFRIAAVNNIFGITGGSNGLFGTARPEFLLPWIEPIPLITLIAILIVYAITVRKSPLNVQLLGGAAIALAYYLPPLITGQEPLFVLSIVMGLLGLLVASMTHNFSYREAGALWGIAVVFALIMLIGGGNLAGAIDQGVRDTFKVGDPIEGPMGMTFVPVAFKRDPIPYYYLVLIFIIITLVGMLRLQDSRLGRAWLYVREDELAAEATGIDTTRVKLAAFAIGSAWAGVAGTLYASRFTVVSPDSFDFLQSVIIFCIVVLGGSGSIPGILVGTLGMVVLPELLRDVAPTFLIEGIGPFAILALILAFYIHSRRQHLTKAALEAGAIALAFIAPTLLTAQPSLYLAGIVAALVGVWIASELNRRDINPIPWLWGGAVIYIALLTLAGQGLAQSLSDGIHNFRITDWRDGLMGAAMVLMMILRPAGLIPERRRGIVFSAVAEVGEGESVSTPQLA